MMLTLNHLLSHLGSSSASPSDTSKEIANFSHVESCVLISDKTTQVIVNLPFVPVLDHRRHLTLHFPLGILSDSPDSPLAKVDVILVAEPFGMLALPFLLRNWAGKIYATEAAVEFGRWLMEDWVNSAEYSPGRFVTFSDGCQNINTTMASFYSRKELLSCLEMIKPIRFGEYHHVCEDVTIRPYCSGYAPGSSNWLLILQHLNIFIMCNSSTIPERLSEPISFQDLPSIDFCIHIGQVLPSYNVSLYLDVLVSMVQQICHAIKSNQNCLLCIPPNFSFFDIVQRIYECAKITGISRLMVISYMDIADFLRRLPILSELISDTPWTQSLITVTPGLSSETTKLLQFVRKAPVLIIVSSVDFQTTDHVENICNLFREYGNPISQIFIADNQYRANRFKKVMNTLKQPQVTKIESFILEPSLTIKEWYLMMEQDALKNSLHAIPDYYLALEEIAEIILQWNKDQGKRFEIYETKTLLASEVGKEFRVDGIVKCAIPFEQLQRVAALVNNETKGNVIKMEIKRKQDLYCLPEVQLNNIRNIEITFEENEWKPKVCRLLEKSNVAYDITNDKRITIHGIGYIEKKEEGKDAAGMFECSCNLNMFDELMQILSS